MFLARVDGRWGKRVPTVHHGDASARRTRSSAGEAVKSLGSYHNRVFYLRGMPAPVDASGAPVFTNEALSKQIQPASKRASGKRSGSPGQSVVDAVSSSGRRVQQACDFAADEGGDATRRVTSPPVPMARFRPRRRRGEGRASAAPRESAPSGFVRAQSVFFNPATGDWLWSDHAVANHGVASTVSRLGS